MLAVFDVDGTLINGDSLFLAARKSQSFFRFLISYLLFFPCFLFWKLNLISDVSAKEKFIKHFKICEKFNKEEFLKNNDWFLNILKERINIEALNRIHFHKEKGDKVVLCSASLDMLITPLANYLEVELISTKLKRNNNKWLPIISGKNIKGINKIIALNEKEGSDNQLIYEAYGDSLGDKELLLNSKFPHYKSFNSTPVKYPNYSFKNLIFIVGAFFLLYGIISTFFHNQVFATIRVLDITFFKAILSVLIGYFVRFIRWRILLINLGLVLPIKDDFLSWMGSYAFTASPGKSGELIRSYFLFEKFGISLIKTTSALLFERISDLFSVIIIILLNWKLFIYLKNFYSINPLFILFSSIIFLAAFLFAKKFKNKIKNILNYFIKKFLPKKFKNVSSQSLNYLKNFLNLRLILITTVLGTISWLLEGFGFWLIIRKIGTYDINVIFATLVHTTSGLLGGLSMLPGGIGTTELTMFSFLSFKKIPLEVAGQVIIVTRLITLWFATFLGFISLGLRRIIN